jgi:hypothetical protein
MDYLSGCRCSGCLEYHFLSPPINVSYRGIDIENLITKLNTDRTSLTYKINPIILDRITYKKFNKRSI